MHAVEGSATLPIQVPMVLNGIVPMVLWNSTHPRIRYRGGSFNNGPSLMGRVGYKDYLRFFCFIFLANFILCHHNFNQFYALID